MEQSFWQQESFIWGLILIVVFPSLIVVLSEIIFWLQKRNLSLVATVQIIRNLVLPSAAIFILLTKILGFSGDRHLIQIVETLVWIFIIHGILSLLNELLFGSTNNVSLQSNIPRLFRDLIRFFLILVGTSIVLSVVWGADLGGLITALGVSSIVLGLALQDTLGNLFSGIALLFEKPFGLGDWIEVAELKGKVVEINWRSVHLLTRELELLVIPNGILAKEVLRNYRRPQKLHVEPVDIGFSYNDPPNKVKRILKEIALNTKGVLDKPEPIIQTMNYNDSSIDYRVKLFLSDYNKVPQIRDEFMTRIWYAANRNGLNIPFPIRTLYHQPPVKSQRDELLNQFVNYLSTFPSFIGIERGYNRKLAQDAIIKHYGTGETPINQGQKSLGLYLIIAGQARVAIKNNQGQDEEIARLSRGEFFGEMSLIAERFSSISVTAIEDLEVLILKIETVQAVIDSIPRLSREIGEIIETRRKAIRLVQKNGD